MYYEAEFKSKFGRFSLSYEIQYPKKAHTVLGNNICCIDWYWYSTFATRTGDNVLLSARISFFINMFDLA